MSAPGGVSAPGGCGRPTVSVVMPFAGDAQALQGALATLAALCTDGGDQLILAFNGGCEPPSPLADAGAPGGCERPVEVVTAEAERSPAHARNAGAACARGQWLLFIDADTIAPADLIDRYFARPPGPGVGALAGEIVPGGPARTLAARYAARRNFLSASAHLAHPHRPRASSANLLVRREAFIALGGFHEGLRAGEDTDLCWRLQRAGWRLEHRPQAVVAHRYRRTVGELRSQWRAYAAGRTWLARRHPGFRPQPAAARALGALRARRAPGARPALGGRPGLGGRPALGALRVLRGRPRHPVPAPGRSRAREPLLFCALDVLLAGEELVGLTLSNRAPGARPAPLAGGPARVVAAGEFPRPGVALAGPARVEAARRPERAQLPPAGVSVAYREDDGAAERLWALVALAARRPRRVLAEARRGDPLAPSLWLLAPAARRLARQPSAVLEALEADAQPAAARLARLAGRDHPRS